MNETVIVSAVRTPIGKLNGQLKNVTASELGGMAIKEAVHRSKVQPDEIEEVIMGHVLQGGNGQLPSRQAARHAGLPWHIESETINKVCASGLRSITLGEQFIRLGEKAIVVAGGMESMSQAPYLLEKARDGFRMGHQQLKDSMISDGLTCTFTGVHMGTYGNEVAHVDEITREEQDQWALRSHQRAIQAVKEGRFAEELTPIEIPQRKGTPILITEDEAPRADTTLQKLSQLKSAFSKDGTITAGNAPGINDGAAALVLMNKSLAEEKGIVPLARIVAHASLAVEAKDFPKTPGFVIEKLLHQTGKTIEDIALVEINEAFAVVTLTSMKFAKIPPEKVNVHGGAIALGHPIGASGARIVVTLIHALKQRGGGLGIAAICSGSGQGDAIMIEV